MSQTLDEILLEPARHELFRLARRARPEEACGLLEYDGRRITVHGLLNVAEEPETSFLVDPHEQIRLMLEIEGRGTELWALWHSHPSEGAAPSERDRAFAAEIGSLRWVIVGLEPESVWVGNP